MNIEHIRIGDAENRSPVFISKAAGNHHISVTGMSGSGKTVWLTFLETWLASKGATVIVLDYADTHNLSRMSSPWQSDFERYSRIIDVKRDGIPFSLWPKHSLGESDPRGDVLAVLDTVLRMADLSTMQCAYLYDVLEKDCYPHRADQHDPLEFIRQSVGGRIANCPSDEKRELQRIYTKLTLTARMAKINPKLTISPGTINVLDIDYGDGTGTAVCNLLLSLLWQDMQNRQVNAAPETFLVLDEYQHLDLSHSNAPLSNILREGRRYGLSVILSTQNLSGFTAKEKGLINQAATKIYFRQTKRDAYEIARGLPDKERQALAKTLTSLQVGQCRAEGIFAVEKMLKNSMVTLNVKKGPPVTTPTVREVKMRR